jgi:hypothetical protein
MKSPEGHSARSLTGFGGRSGLLEALFVEALLSVRIRALLLSSVR